MHKKARHTSLRRAVNTLESSQQNTILSARDGCDVSSGQSLRGVGLQDRNHPRENTTNNGQSLQLRDAGDGDCLHAESKISAGEVCSCTDQQASEYLSLRYYSDCVVTVPTPRTSSPILDRSQRGDVSSMNIEPEREAGSRKVGGDDDDGGRKGAGDGEELKDVAGRNRGSTQLQKTMSRLKRYFGLAAACGTTSESRQDDVSCASREAACQSADIDREEIAAVDVPPARHAHSQRSGSLDTAAANVHHIPQPDPRGIHRLHDDAEKHGELKARHRRAGPAAGARAGNEKNRCDEGASNGAVTGQQRFQRGGRKTSVDDLALATVVPGVRVRVPPRRQMSQHDRHATDSDHAVEITAKTGNWLDEAHARSRVNVERWLSQSSQTADAGRWCSTLSRQQRHRHSVQQRAVHQRDEFRLRPSRTSEMPAADMSKMERSLSETDVGPRAAADVDLHFRSRDQHRTTPNRSSVVGTPSMVGSAAGESHLGPSLVQLVAEIIEGLEQKSRDDDSSAVWSGMRGPGGTPASKIFEQITKGAKNADPVRSRSRTAVENRGPGDAGRDDPTTPGRIRNDNTNSEALSEKTLTGRRGDSEKQTDEENSSAVVPSSSVAVLRHRLLRAVEGKSNRRGAVPERPLQRRRAEDQLRGETATGNSRAPPAFVTCCPGNLPHTHVLCLSGFMQAHIGTAIKQCELYIVVASIVHSLFLLCQAFMFEWGWPSVPKIPPVLTTIRFGLERQNLVW